MVPRVLVTLQMAAIFVLLLPGGGRGSVLGGGGIMAAGLGWLAWAVKHNRPGNFNIRPESRAGALLITSGPYRLVRHPMYTGVLLFGVGVVVLSPTLWRMAAWLALLAVLIAKAKIEEAALRRQFADYEAYGRGRRFLVPGVW
jgi:protein-S-isoprenylcysteine O-methyltransferase Ste14